MPKIKHYIRNGRQVGQITFCFDNMNRPTNCCTELCSSLNYITPILVFQILSADVCSGSSGNERIINKLRNGTNDYDILPLKI